MDRAFSNGAVSIKGNCQLNYVGTVQSEIDKRGNVTIESLATDLSYQSLPQPDWEALENITTLKTDKKIKDTVSNVKYKNNLKISGKGEVQGILVVDGDLEISGKTRFPNTGIFCTGEVIISGNPEITGVIYTGDGLKMSGTPEVNGALVVDGSATISGSVESNQVKIKEYLDYLRKTDSEQ
ncbi:MAG: polymer-forming cytoskeletal protein [Bacillota bacterium]